MRAAQLATGRPRVPASRLLPVPGLALVPVVLLLLAVVLLALRELVLVEVVEAALSASATFTCASRAARLRGRRRRGWAWLAAGCAGWAAGQLWIATALLLGWSQPFPSPADAGFLFFPVATGTALVLLTRPASRPQGSGDHRLLDVLTVLGGIGLATWSTALAPVAHSSAAPAAIVVALAYPVSDVVLLTTAVLVLGRRGPEQRSLSLVAAGLLAMAASDSWFAVTAAARTGYDAGAAELGWCAASAAFALAAVVPAQRLRDVRRASGHQHRHGPGDGAQPCALPHLVLVPAGLVVLVRYATGSHFDAAFVWCSALLVGLVVLRQWLAGRENARLLRAVADREALLHHQAVHDRLTGLPDRAAFVERTTRALRGSGPDGAPLTVGIVDLDGFKAVNDSLGAAAGDEVLHAVAGRLRCTLRSADTVARLGDDEFALLLDHCAGADAEAVAQAVLAALRAPVVLSAGSVSVSASIGLATHQPGHPDPGAAALLARADVALQDVKRHGKNGVRTHSCELRLDGADDLALRPALARALAGGEVRAVFQPIVALGNGRTTSYEALARWEHDGRAVPPPVFVGVAERTGLSTALTDLMLERTCAQLARWRAVDPRCDVAVAVNVSPAELVDPGLSQRVLGALERHGVPPGHLVVEVTESGLLLDLPRALAVMDELRGHGVRFSLDDFGTGYSSLSQLLSIPLDVVKIDRAFVEDIDRDATRRTFLEGVLRLTGHIGLRTVAEGIERPAQLELLRAMGCTWGQGYLLGRPAPAPDRADEDTRTDVGPVSAARPVPVSG